MLRYDRAMEPRAHRVVVLALAGLLPFELGIPHRIFGYAKNPAGRPFYETLTCALRPGPVATDADFAVSVEHGPELLATADTVVVPASYELGPVYEEGRLTAALGAALGHIRPGTRLVSICTGAMSSPPAGTSTAAGRPPTGPPPSTSSGSSRPCGSTPACSTRMTGTC